MPNYKLIVSYDGTDFHGWQKQHPPDSEPMRTCQGVLEDTVRRVVREPITILGASRTDAGVHAVGQVAVFSSTRTLPLDRLRIAINGRLPRDMQVRELGLTHASFNPISDALSKGYTYSISFGSPMEHDRPLFDRHLHTWLPVDLDVGLMNEGAQHLVGEFDFASFTRVNHGRKGTVREVYSCVCKETGPHRCAIEVSGNGFLYNMVRVIAGTLVEVGRGQLKPDEIPSIRAACDRSMAGPTLPPEGLCLKWIKYPDVVDL